MDEITNTLTSLAFKRSLRIERIYTRSLQTVSSTYGKCGTEADREAEVAVKGGSKIYANSRIKGGREERSIKAPDG